MDLRCIFGLNVLEALFQEVAAAVGVDDQDINPLGGPDWGQPGNGLGSIFHHYFGGLLVAKVYLHARGKIFPGYHDGDAPANRPYGRIEA